MRKGLGLKPDTFKKAIERYGTWPVTVWDCNYTDKFMQKMKDEIGDVCSARLGSGSLGYQSKSARKECFTKAEKDGGKSVYGGKITESIFNPLTAIWTLNLYAPKEGVCYDPFAGGGTRAIITAKFGLKYVGVEIRKEEIDSIYNRCSVNDVDGTSVTIHHASAADPPIKDGVADFLLTCPPYWNLEKYRGGKDDLSMAESYGGFLEMMRPCVRHSFRILKSGSKACWVVGLHRDKDMTLLPIHHDIARIHKEEGFKFKEEVVLHLTHTGAIRRVGFFDKGGNHLIRTHEYLLVFVRP